MSPEFYHPAITERSWTLLNQLHDDFSFVLIGGWAAWCYAQKEKSRDVDVVVDYTTLTAFQQRFSVVKNERLRKYEIPADGFGVDIYVEHYSTTLSVPPAYVLSHTRDVAGFSVPEPEALLALKATAWLNRRHSTHGDKDHQDILRLLPFCNGVALRRVMAESGMTADHRRAVDQALSLLLPEMPKRVRTTFLGSRSRWNPVEMDPPER